MTDLMELASRVEAGEGPDRGLDADIQDAVRLGGYKADRDGCSGRVCGTMTRMASDGDGVEWKPLPAFTASLDAAMTLVPEGKESEAVYSEWSAVASKHALHVRYWKRAKDGDYAQELARHVVAFALRARAHKGAAHVDQ